MVGRDQRGLWPATYTRAMHGGTVLPQRRALAIVLGVVWLVWRMGPSAILAAAPDVREITPAGIAIDGLAGDWDEPAADFLSDMFEAGKPDKDVLSRLYGRYDCSTETFYVLVQTVPGWNILPSDNDNYVKLGQTDKLVDGSSGHNGVPPDFAYIGAKAGRLPSISPRAATSATTASTCTPRWYRTPALPRQRWRTAVWTSPSTAARRRPRRRRPRPRPRRRRLPRPRPRPRRRARHRPRRPPPPRHPRQRQRRPRRRHPRRHRADRSSHRPSPRPWPLSIRRSSSRR